MKQIDLHEAKTNLSGLVDQTAAGEAIIITKDGKARAKLVPIDPTQSDPPRRGPVFGAWAHYGWTPPDNFDHPDPEIEAIFYGEPEPHDSAPVAQAH